MQSDSGMRFAIWSLDLSLLACTTGVIFLRISGEEPKARRARSASRARGKEREKIKWRKKITPVVQATLTYCGHSRFYFLQTLFLMQEQVIRKSILLAYFCDSGNEIFIFRDPLYFFRSWTGDSPCATLREDGRTGVSGRPSDPLFFPFVNRRFPLYDPQRRWSYRGSLARFTNGYKTVIKVSFSWITEISNILYSF